jgi:methionine-rich copper-binding protein CopC
MKKVLLGLVATLMVLSQAPSAVAHAQLTASSVKPGAIVRSWPKVIWVEFDGNLIQIDGGKVNSLTIKDLKNKQIDLKNSTSGGARISVGLGKAPSAGKVTVAWRVVSEDGHPVQSSFTFVYLPLTNSKK